MSESSNTRPLLDEYGKVKDAELAEKMAYTEKEIRNTFNKTDDRSEVDQWANQASEGAFRQETGKEYSDELKEAQEETAYREKADQVKQEIKAEVSKVEEEIKSNDEIVARKDGAAKEDVIETRQADAKYETTVKNEAITAKDRIENVVASQRAAKFSRKDAKNLTKAALGSDVSSRPDADKKAEDIPVKQSKVAPNARISPEGLEKLKNLRDKKTEPKIETEIKNPELSAKKEQLEKELSDIKFNLNVFENGKKEELDALVNHMIREGRARGNPESKGARIYLEKGLKDQRSALYRAKALLDQSKSPEEFYQKIQNEIDLIKNNRQKELDEVFANDIDEDKKKEERKIINNKYDFRQGAYLNYLPPKIKSEPIGEPPEPKAVEPKIDAKPADVQPDSQPNRNERDEIAAAYDQRIANLRLGVNEAKESGNKNEAARLEKFVREVENEKKWRLRNADGKDQGSEENKDIKPQVQNKDAQAAKDKIVEPKNFDQEWQNLREQIKQAEKDGKGEEVKRLEQEIYKLEQKKRDEKALAQARKNEARKKGQIAEIEKRIANLRAEIIAAEKADKEDEVLRLEEDLRGAQREKSSAEGKFIKAKDNKINASKTKAAQGKTIKEPSKNPTELESDVAETKHKTNGPVYGKESTPEDAQEEAERIKNGKKAEGKKEESASVEAIASKEKTAEEIKKEEAEKPAEEPPKAAAEIEPEYKGGLPAVIEAAPKVELTNEQAARVERILKDFDLTAEDAEKIEGFKDLSYGQRLLALQNLRQLTLRDVRIGAVKTQKEEAAQTKGFWKRMWKGIKKRYDIAKHEKSIANDLNKEDYAATLAQLARGMKELKTDVVEKNGQLEFQYVSGLENLTPEQAARVQRFNEVASELSKLPMEWTADNSKKGFFRQIMDKAGLGQAWSPDDPTRSQHRRTGELNAEFQSLKQEVVQIIKRQKDADLKKGGIEKFDDLETQSHATAQMLQIENLLRYNRAMNINPDAEKALLEIKSAPLWKRALNNIATEKGIYFVAGFAARSVSMSLLGTAGIIGGAAGMGGYMGYKRGKETLRENDALAQHKDFEETKKKRIEKFERAKQGKAGQAGEAEKTEKRIEDANVLTRNLENFVEYIKEEDDPKRQMDLSRRLRDRVKFVKDALDQGRINFGATGERAANLYELTDKLNNAVNCVEIYHPSTRHEADQWSEANQSKVMEKLNQYLAESKIELDAERRKYLVKQLAKGAMWGAGFASAGMIARELFSHLDPHLFNAQGETDLGVRWISGGGSSKPLVGGIVGKYLHGEPGGGGGGSIPPHEAGMPAGSGSGKSAYEAFMGNKPKDYDMFPWQKSTESIQEIPMGRGSFAERFLRAVGMHEGSPAKPDLQKIVADYSEYFKHHPDLLKNNNSSLEYLNHLKSDLQSAGLDGRAANSIVKNFSTEMRSVGTGIYPEGEVLPGIEATGVGSGSGSAVEQAASAAGSGKTIDAVIGAKQDIVNSAVETASGKLDSVWKMAEHQLDQKGFFKDLSGTVEEIAAKKTYLIDAIKDKVAENPQAFGLKDVDEVVVGQKVDFSKIFENESLLKQILLAKADKLSPQEIVSILTHNKNIADFHHLHPDVGITSENVGQIAAGHGEALLKKAVAQAAEQAAPAPVEPAGPQEPPVSDQWHDFGDKTQKFESVKEDLFTREGQIEKIAGERTADHLNKIFDYAFGRQGAETTTYEAIKDKTMEYLLKGDFSNEVDVNGSSVFDSDDVRRYGELQESIKEMINNNHLFPKIGETVGEFIKRSFVKEVRGEVAEAMESPIDPKSELI